MRPLSVSRPAAFCVCLSLRIPALHVQVRASSVCTLAPGFHSARPSSTLPSLLPASLQPHSSSPKNEYGSLQDTGTLIIRV